MRSPLRVGIAALIGWALTISLASAQSPSGWRKLDPFLAPLLTRPLSEVSHLRDIARDGQIRALVRTTGDPRALSRFGVVVTTAVENIAAVSIPPDRLRDLVDAPDLVYMEAARRMTLASPMLDASAVAVGAVALHGSRPAYTGRNVAIGIIDAGLDVTHPAFKTERGRSRVLAAWDQVISVPGRNPPEASYGTEWSADDIDAGRAFGMNDPSGHGTHVAGIAAGNGRWTDAAARGLDSNVSRVGIAPNADLIVVKTALLTPDILDAIAYILLRARQFGLPVVVNMSFGNTWGPHDGRGLMNEGIELLAQNSVGVAFVAAAGNDGDSLTHARFELREDDPPRRLYFRSFFANESVFVEAWQRSNAEVQVTPLFPRNNAGDLTDFGVGGAVAGQIGGGIVQAGPAKGIGWFLNFVESPEEYPDLDELFVQYSRDGDYGARLDANVYALEFSGFGTVDVWVHEGEFVLPDDDETAVEPDGLRTVGSPAAAPSVVAVGSYATRTSWLDSDGVVQSRTLASVGRRSDYSSVGPRRDGFEKPDVLAPGEYVLAPLSSDMVAFVEPDRLSADGRHIAFRGTSLSSAHVAGLAALMLEQNPTLTPSETLERVRAAGVDARWTAENGTGAVDGLRLLGVPAPPRGVRADVNGATATVAWEPNDEPDVAFYRVVVDGAAQDARDGARLAGIPLAAAGTSVSVTAVNAAGRESAPSERLTLTPNVSVASPTGVRVEPLRGRLAVSWSRVANAVRYRVAWGATSGAYPMSSETPNASYIVNGVADGATTYIVVTAFDAAGNASEPSTEARGASRADVAFVAPVMPVRAGFPVETTHDIFGSAAVADVDGDGRSEIFVGCADGNVYGYDANGAPLAGWPQSVGDPVVSSVSIGDLDRNGAPEIVATAGRRVHVWAPNGAKGRGFPVTAPNLIRAEPVLANLDDDPALEIVVSVAEGASGVYAWNNRGQLVDGTPFRFDDGAFAYTPPVVADRDLDGAPEVYATTAWGPVYGWNAKGAALTGFPIMVDFGVAEHAPAIAAFLGDGDLGLIFSDVSAGIVVVDGKGEVAPGFPAPMVTQSNAGVATGDLDGDGVAEIVCADDRGYLIALRGDGSVVDRFPISLLDVANVTPLLADLDGDSKSEIVTVGNALYNGGCVVNVLSPDGSPLAVASLDVNIVGTPTLADLDGDGQAELVAATLRRDDDTTGHKPVTALGGRVYVWNLPFLMKSAVWTTHQGGSTRLGVAPFGLPAPSEITNFAAVWRDDRLRLTWQTTRERGNLGYEVRRSESADGPFERAHDALVRARGGEDSVTDYRVDDAGADPAKTLFYRLVNIGSMNRETVSETIEARPRAEQTLATQWGRLKKVVGLAPFPAPSNPEVWIPFRLGEATTVSVVVSNLAGEFVRRLELGGLPAGDYVARDRAAYWDGRNELGESVAAGVYVARVVVDGATSLPKRILIVR